MDDHGQPLLATAPSKLEQLHCASKAAASTSVPSTAWSNQAVLDRLKDLKAKWLRVYWQDYTGSVRMRLIPIKRVQAVLQSGKPFTISITKASLGLLQIDACIPQQSATGIYTACPDWSSLMLGPAEGHASCFAELREPNGTTAVLCPRALLRKILEKSKGHGLSFIVGFELEFIVMERNLDPNSGEKYCSLQNDDGHAWSMARSVADWGRSGSFTTTMDEIVEALEAAGIDIELFHPEAAPGQYEIVLPPLPPLEACDALLHTRQILEATAARHSFRVTLHPKPFAMACGSASHVHLSISSPGGDKPETYESFYAGILRHFRAIIAFTYSNPTSYERMVDSFWAGGRWVTWGTQNKETPLRKCEDSHWELKTMDGLANPYLALAAILSAGTSGVVAKEPLVWGDCEIDPAKLTEAQKEDLGVSQMFPANLTEALQALQEDKELSCLLNPLLVEHYVRVKTAELAFLDPMSAEERRQWILERY
ncbi:hypothetical protein S7711_09820 [Stachybotrys chartarum IBT 7711]|uniref:Glutamine synthetase n=1 Tax=Stachybotrys chartarum (strain CBS 109288 / IBT 7711) TaxID=1280523 RepID=A0A084B7N1_STACB|nr:hypothetical protein S7711_09820 [Stachybotrys chartarum IBT 7711]